MVGEDSGEGLYLADAKRGERGVAEGEVGMVVGDLVITLCVADDVEGFGRHGWRLKL